MVKWFTFERVTTVWALALGTTALLTIFVGLGVWISDNSANVASWVQAVGSIAAIAAGFGVAWYQVASAQESDALKTRRAENARCFTSAVTLIDAYENAALWASNTVGSIRDRKPYWKAYTITSQSVVEQFQRFDPFDLSDPVDVALVAALRRQIQNLNGTFILASEKGMGDVAFQSLESNIHELGATALENKQRSIDAARRVGNDEQLQSLEKLLELYEQRSVRNSQ